MQANTLIHCRSIPHFEKAFSELGENDQVFFDSHNDILTIRSEHNFQIHQIKDGEIQETTQI